MFAKLLRKNPHAVRDIGVLPTRDTVTPLQKLTLRAPVLRFSSAWPRPVPWQSTGAADRDRLIAGRLDANRSDVRELA
jgi:hypothetical protein